VLEGEIFIHNIGKTVWLAQLH